MCYFETVSTFNVAYVRYFEIQRIICAALIFDRIPSCAQMGLETTTTTKRKRKSKLKKEKKKRQSKWVVEKEDRLCYFCSNLGGELVGNEIHVLDVCLHFCEERANTATAIRSQGVEISDDSIYNALVDLDKYPKSIRHNVWYAVACFAHQIFECRRERDFS